MRLLALFLLLTAVAACSTPETPRPGGEPDPYLSGYAAPGPIEPAEFTYDDPNASFRFSRSDGIVTFRELEAEAVSGGLDWPTLGSAGMADEDWDDYDPQGDFDLYGNEYGGYGRGGGRHRRPIVRPPIQRPPPPPPAPKELNAGKSPAPDVGAEGRRKAKTAPARPSRSDARTPPERGKR